MKILSVAGDRVVVLVAGGDTRQQYTVMESTVPPGGGPPLHLHHREDETFQVLSGEITFQLGDKTLRLKPGEFLFAPRGIPHVFRNTGDTDAILLETASPAGIENYFEAVGHPLTDREQRPLPATPEDIHLLRTLAPRYGIELLAPKPGESSPAVP